MLKKILARKKRALKVRSRIQGMRLSVHKTNQHIYAQVIDIVDGATKVIASASTKDKELQKSLKGSKSDKAKQVGLLIAKRAKAAGIEKVAFDRSGFRYHGRVKALADGVREGDIQL